VEQLLSTKFYIPATRKDLVSRPRLVEWINEGLDRKLTLISAPAGFGKTTLVSEWVKQLPDAVKIKNVVSWLSLDENDNDPVRFLNYVIGAIRQAEGVDSDLGKGALGILQSPQAPPTETVLISLINDITACPNPIILILDDYHTISSPSVSDGLSFLLEHQPPNFHLVIATREDPQLPLSRLRAGGQLNELRAKELRFNSPEAGEFLNQVMGLNLSEEDIHSLETRTEGWIAGLQLAAVSIQSHENRSHLIKAFSGSHRLVLDYLIEEVLEQQSESRQNFLLQTAVLDRMTGSLCDTVTGQKGGDETLAALEQANLFIVPLDDERRWYRYHHLFADLLRKKLNETNPGQLPILHEKASDWFEQNGFPDEAIEHALKCDNFERAAVLIEVQADAIWGRGEHAKLFRFLDKLPEQVLLTKPLLGIYQATKLFTSGEQVKAELSLEAVENAFEQSFDISVEKDAKTPILIPDSKQATIRGRIAHIRAELAFYRGDLKAISTYSRQALKHLPEEDLSWRSLATVALGDAYVVAGDTKEACRLHLD
jgi:LuxR family maltose regulon positive regulatory protein